MSWRSEESVMALWARVLISLGISIILAANAAAPSRIGCSASTSRRCWRALPSLPRGEHEKGGLSLAPRGSVWRRRERPGGGAGQARREPAARHGLRRRARDAAERQAASRRTGRGPAAMGRQGATGPMAWCSKIAGSTARPGGRSEPLDGRRSPPSRNRSWVRTPIDAFILARLEAEGLRPSPEADRRTLIRRLTYDLHGLPPTPGGDRRVPRATMPRSLRETGRPAAGLAAIRRAVGPPLAGHRPLRRHARLRQGQAAGPCVALSRLPDPALNEDVPIANSSGSKSPATCSSRDPRGVIATGFIAAGPWDFVGHVELCEETVEKVKTRLLDRDDMVANTISTFVSLTVHCARCHDHKFDPIPQAITTVFRPSSPASTAATGLRHPGGERRRKRSRRARAAAGPARGDREEDVAMPARRRPAGSGHGGGAGASGRLPRPRARRAARATATTRRSIRRQRPRRGSRWTWAAPCPSRRSAWSRPGRSTSRTLPALASRSASASRFPTSSQLRQGGQFRRRRRSPRLAETRG